MSDTNHDGGYPTQSQAIDGVGGSGSFICELRRLPAYEPQAMDFTSAIDPDIWTSSNRHFTAGGRGPLPNEWYLVRKANSTAQDTSSQTGWSIGDAAWIRGHASDDYGDWAEHSTSPKRPLAVAIYASPN